MSYEVSPAQAESYVQQYRNELPYDINGAPYTYLVETVRFAQSAINATSAWDLGDAIEDDLASHNSLNHEEAIGFLAWGYNFDIEFEGADMVSEVAEQLAENLTNSFGSWLAGILKAEDD